jgi:hypothetical protein
MAQVTDWVRLCTSSFLKIFYRWFLTVNSLMSRIIEISKLVLLSDMIGEIALAIEMGADAVDIGKTIHPHPTLGESIGMAAEVAHGSCTDLPPVRI